MKNSDRINLIYTFIYILKFFIKLYYKKQINNMTSPDDLRT